MNQDCEDLVRSYGALQQCDAKSQAEMKAAFESRLADFAGRNQVADLDKLRAFVQTKWFSVINAESRGRRITTAIDPE